MQKLSYVETISLKFVALLHNVGIDDQEQLLTHCSEKEKREAIAIKTGINSKLLLKWTIQADFARVNGIGFDYAELLERSGVNDVSHLVQFHPDKLLDRLQKFNDQYHLVRQTPSLSQVTAWIEHAQTLPTRIKS